MFRRNLRDHSCPCVGASDRKKPFKVDRSLNRNPSGIFPIPRHNRVDTGKHFLYLVESYGSARRYGIGVGKAGRSLKGEAVVERKAKWPSWRPTANMIRREPGKYAKYAAGVPGGPGNPLGSRALYLYRNGRDTMYRIHGTTEPSSIGRSVSNGCVRMINVHVEDLFERVPLGTRVIIL